MLLVWVCALGERREVNKFLLTWLPKVNCRAYKYIVAGRDRNEDFSFVLKPFDVVLALSMVGAHLLSLNLF